jgi:hypothetical protein
MPQTEEFRLPPEELEFALAGLLDPPGHIAIFLGGHCKGDDTAGERAQGLSVEQAHNGAHQASDLRVVATGMGGAGLGIR